MDALAYILDVTKKQGEVKIECVKQDGEESIYKFPVSNGYIKGTETHIRQKLTPLVMQAHFIKQREESNG